MAIVARSNFFGALIFPILNQICLMEITNKYAKLNIFHFYSIHTISKAETLLKRTNSPLYRRLRGQQHASKTSNCK